MLAESPRLSAPRSLSPRPKLLVKSGGGRTRYRRIVKNHGHGEPFLVPGARSSGYRELLSRVLAQTGIAEQRTDAGEQ